MNLFLALLPEAIGVTDPIISSYARKNSTERWLFRLSEFLLLVEVFNHLADIKPIQSHIFWFSIWANIICFWVIPYFNAVSRAILAQISLYFIESMGRILGRDS